MRAQKWCGLLVLQLCNETLCLERCLCCKVKLKCDSRLRTVDVHGAQLKQRDVGHIEHQLAGPLPNIQKGLNKRRQQLARRILKACSVAGWCRIRE